MAILQVRDIDDRLYAALKTAAKRENRSLSQEVISILEKYLAHPEAFGTNATRDFLSLSGAWDDDRSADRIIADVKARRTTGGRFSPEKNVFD